MSATASGDGFVAADAAEVGLACCDAELQPHQVVGVNWLLLLERVGANGVLADDMGLGKTVQTIAHLQVARSRTARKSRDVVVVPASTLGNWQREFKRFAPGCAVTVYHGSQAERRQLRTDGDVLRADVVLTTYTWWERDACADDRSWFASRGPWTHLVLDEGHNLKNPDAQRSKRLRALKAESRTILSGTPIMNRPLDLLSLLLFLMPKLFASCGVTGELPEVLAALARDGEAAGDAGGLNQLRKLLAPFCLRRVKADVLASLPTKTAEVVSVPLSATQRLRRGRARAHREDAPRQRHRRAATLAMVTKELESYDDFALHELCAEYADASGDGFSSLGDLALGTNALFESAKCERLRELLPKLKKEGHKVLLFSQWVRLLDLLGLLCDDLDLNWSRLDGSTPITERQQLVADFNDPAGDLDVFLLSTRAGGLGINLTGADTVIIHDVDFNPEIDRQAEDRAHRIGQTKPVTVYRLVAEDTVDRDIIDLANRKRAVNERVMRDGDAAADEESKEDDKEARRRRRARPGPPP
ncbi:helicase [Aureococcus anophagefferens]|nr:helicase [Aureococcus anophagefferens]